MPLAPLLLRDQIRKNPLRDGGFGYLFDEQSSIPGLQGNREVLSSCALGIQSSSCSYNLSAESAEQAGFRGLVAHTSEVASRLDQILSEAQANPEYSVIVVGGKSAQDISSHLARHGVSGVTIVFEREKPVCHDCVELSPNMRSGGNWIMWLPVLKAISVDEIARLREERHTKREADALQPESSFPLAK